MRPDAPDRRRATLIDDRYDIEARLALAAWARCIARVIAHAGGNDPIPLSRSS